MGNHALTMERVPVSSSNVASVGYDVATSTLEVEYLDGSVYQYFDVPQHEHNALMGSGSIGGYLNSNIKNQYRYSRM